MYQVDCTTCCILFTHTVTKIVRKQKVVAVASFQKSCLLFYIYICNNNKIAKKQQKKKETEKDKLNVAIKSTSLFVRAY